jgi:hypothetical protein
MQAKDGGYGGFRYMMENSHLWWTAKCRSCQAPLVLNHFGSWPEPGKTYPIPALEGVCHLCDHRDLYAGSDLELEPGPAPPGDLQPPSNPNVSS